MKKTIYALGFFDGVHLGHRALLNECRRLAREADCLAGAITFGSHPDELVFGRAPVLINTPEDRERLLRRDMDRVITLPFDEKMHTTPWMDFLELLDEVESIVSTGTKLNLNYYINTQIDDFIIDEIFDWFKSESVEGTLDEALGALGSDYSETEIRLCRLKFLCEVAS